MLNVTMRKDKMKCATVYLAAGFIVACYLAQTADCHRPKQPVDRKRATIGVQEGTIVFGSDSESHVVNGNMKPTSNASAVEDERTYQADFAGWSKGHAEQASPREASFKRMAPSLQCGRDQMKFRAVGPGVTHFAVEQGNAHPVALSQVPSTCGYNMQRNSLALVMLVPYDGCSMVQEGGSYMLPMRWQGNPVSLWCPKPSETPPATTTAEPQDPVPQTLKSPPTYHQVPGSPPKGLYHGQQPYSIPPYWGHPGYHSVVLPHLPLPTTADTTPAKAEPTSKQLLVPPYWHHLPQVPPQVHHLPQLPPEVKDPNPVYQFPVYQHPYPPHHWPLPTTAETTATMAEPTTTKSQLPQVPAYWHQMPQLPPAVKDPNPVYQFPVYHHPYPPHHWPLPTTAATTATMAEPTTTQSPLPQVPAYWHQLPQVPPQVHQLPQVPPQVHQLPQVPPAVKDPNPVYQFPVYQHPYPPHHWPLLTTPETTTTTTEPTTTQALLPQEPHLPPYWPQMSQLPPYWH